MKDTLSDLVNSVEGRILLEWAYTSGYYVHTNRQVGVSEPYTVYSGWKGKCLFIQCQPGDKFIVSLLGSSTNLRPWVFFTTNGSVILPKGDADYQYTNYELTAPENAAYVGFNSIPTDEYGEVYLIKRDIDEIKAQLEEEIEEVDTVARQASDKVNSILEGIGATEELIWVYSDGHYIDTRNTLDVQSPYSYSASYYGKCAFIECSPSDVFVISLVGANNFRPYAFVADDGSILKRGDNVTYTRERIVAPKNTAYVAFNLSGRNTEGSVIIGETSFQRYNAEIADIYSKISSPYYGKKCVAFGTSLTYRNSGYRPYLAELLGMEIDNQGVGSSFWCDWQEGTWNVLYNIQQYTEYADKDVCIIEGCVNDWGGNRTLGTYKDIETGTVCGCLYNMISHVYTQNPNIQIIVILDHFGRLFNNNDASPSALNNKELTQYDYYEECAKLCAFYGIPCIKEYAISSITIFGEQYLYDQIHLNELGGQQSAMIIGQAMNAIPIKK